jgi:hypothetical protein
VNRELVQELGKRCPEQRIATVDQDATIIESHKEQALRSYEGERGYQPMLAVWAEMDVVLADEFRDGNVPAMMTPLTVAKRAFAALPHTVQTYYFRGIRLVMKVIWWTGCGTSSERRGRRDALVSPSVRA